MRIKTLLRRAYWIICAQFGMDPRKFLYSLYYIPRYVRDFISFQSRYAGRLELLPCLHDWHEEGGPTRDEYFWQDLLVAKMIFAARPVKHVDIGSRVDGLVAHVASFRDLEVFDFRPIIAQIPGVTFRQADCMTLLEGMSGYCDSLSCLHALEHFGLGRYGDPINPRGFKLGLTNMGHLLRPGGTFYLSVPIGINRVEFNANHVFDPRIIIELALENALRLSALTVIRKGGSVEVIAPEESQLADLASHRYSLGVFIFKKCDVQ